MTEPEWRTTTDVRKMLNSLSARRKRVGFRLDRFRVFAAACVQLDRPLVGDELRAALDEYERGGTVTPEVRSRVQALYRIERDAMWEAFRRVREHSNPGPALRDIPGFIRCAAVRNVVNVVEGKSPFSTAMGATYSSGEPSVLAELVRCVFGNPFRPVAFDPSWRTEAVVGLARGMDETRDFAALPVLADALEDAGCADADLLAHCRGPGPHARGCHVVDHVLGTW